MTKILAGSALRRAVAVGSMALVCGLAAVPATANANDSRCPASRFCLFENANYGGGRIVFATSDGNLAGNRYDNGHSADDSASSMINNTDQTIVLYSIEYHRSGSRSYPAHHNSVDTTFVNNGFNDIASAVYFS